MILVDVLVPGFLVVPMVSAIFVVSFLMVKQVFQRQQQYHFLCCHLHSQVIRLHLAGAMLPFHLRRGHLQIYVSRHQRLFLLRNMSQCILHHLQILVPLPHTLFVSTEQRIIILEQRKRGQNIRYEKVSFE